MNFTSNVTDSAGSSVLSVGVLQMTSTEDWRANLNQIQELSKLLLQQKAPLDFLSLPENALYLRVSEGAQIPKWTLESEPIQELAAWVRSIGVPVHVGSVPLMVKGLRYNATLWVDPSGTIESPYQKIHLFDVDVEGQPRVRESASFTHGSNPHVFNFKGWRIGFSICYDVRFSELYTHYHREQVDVILVPSAFLVPTGRAHWEVLLRARAIESQSFVLAAAQWGHHGGSRRTYGHSLAVDPWGEILMDLGEGTEACRVQLEKSRIQKVRQQIPLLGHRRL